MSPTVYAFYLSILSIHRETWNTNIVSNAAWVQLFFPGWGDVDRTVYPAGNKEEDKVPKLVFLLFHCTSVFGSSSINLFIFAQIPSEHTMKGT